MTPMDAAVATYIDAIPAEHRALFDRLHRLILAVRPDVEIVISYAIPTYRAGRRRLYLAAWKHGVSLYGWHADRDGGFAARHPELISGKATLQIRPGAAAAIPDEEFVSLVEAALRD